MSTLHDSTKTPRLVMRGYKGGLGVGDDCVHT